MTGVDLSAHALSELDGKPDGRVQRSMMNGNANDLALVILREHRDAAQRNSAEGHEGTAAFREKRRPTWYRPPQPDKG